MEKKLENERETGYHIKLIGLVAYVRVLDSLFTDNILGLPQTHLNMTLVGIWAVTFKFRVQCRDWGSDFYVSWDSCKRRTCRLKLRENHPTAVSYVRKAWTDKIWDLGLSLSQKAPLIYHMTGPCFRCLTSSYTPSTS